METEAALRKQIRQRNVYISQLPHDFQPADFHRLAVAFGPVETIKLCMDDGGAGGGACKGYGFVLFVDVRSARWCIEALGGLPYRGQRLQVRLADFTATPLVTKRGGGGALSGRSKPPSPPRRKTAAAAAEAVKGGGLRQWEKFTPHPADRTVLHLQQQRGPELLATAVPLFINMPNFAAGISMNSNNNNNNNNGKMHGDDGFMFLHSAPVGPSNVTFVAPSQLHYTAGNYVLQ